MSCSQIGNAPHTYFFLAFPSPGNVIRGRYPHQRVHLYAKGSLNMQRHISRDVGLAIEQTGKRGPRDTHRDYGCRADQAGRFDKLSPDEISWMGMSFRTELPQFSLSWASSFR